MAVTGRIIVKFIVNQLKRLTLQVYVIDPVKITYLVIIKTSSKEQRIIWLKKVAQLGSQQK